MPEAERVRIHERVLRLHPAAVSSTYNTWIFSRHTRGDDPPEYGARNATWESTFWSSRVFDDLLDAIDGRAIDRVDLVPEDAVSVSVEQALAELLVLDRSQSRQHDLEWLDELIAWMHEKGPVVCATAHEV